MQVQPSSLRDLRRTAGIKARRFAATVGVSPRHLANCESGTRIPSFELAHRIARALNNALGDELPEPLTGRAIRQMCAQAAATRNVQAVA